MAEANLVAGSAGYIIPNAACAETQDPSTRKNGAQIVAQPGEWTMTHAPAVNTVATVTKAAGGPGVRHVLTNALARINVVAAQGVISVYVRDGEAGVGTILWQDRQQAGANAQCVTILTNVAIVGSPDTALTIEYSGVPAVNNFETVSATGYSVG